MKSKNTDKYEKKIFWKRRRERNGTLLFSNTSAIGRAMWEMHNWKKERLNWSIGQEDRWPPSPPSETPPRLVETFENYSAMVFWILLLLFVFSCYCSLCLAFLRHSSPLFIRIVSMCFLLLTRLPYYYA